jgi:CheY-like chemotaxis protein
MKRSGSVCILVVDDHADTVGVLRRLLALEGYSVLTATSAAEAAELARNGDCDLIVSDVGLPDRSGLHLMSELRAQYGLRGIALSGYTEAADLKAARDAGFERFLAKPVQFEKLVAAVRELTA